MTGEIRPVTADEVRLTLTFELHVVRELVPSSLRRPAAPSSRATVR